MIAFDLELAFADGVFDRGDQRIGRGRRRNFFDDDRGLVFGFDLRADFDRAFAVLVIARVHQAAGLKIGQALERLASSESRSAPGAIRGNCAAECAQDKPDRDAFRAEHQQQRQLAKAA